MVHVPYHAKPLCVKRPLGVKFIGKYKIVKFNKKMNKEKSVHETFLNKLIYALFILSKKYFR